MDRLRRYLDLGLIVVLAAAGLAAQFLPLLPVVRAVAGLALVIVCPGYALTAALFPRPSFGRPERSLLTLGLSLTVTILSALALNATRWGIEPRPWAEVLAGVTLAAALAGMARRWAVRAAPAAQGRLSWRPLGPAQWALLACAAALSLGAIALVFLPRPATGVVGYTSLWMLPGSAANSVNLGVDSSELAPTRYQLQVTVDGAVIQDWPAISLAPGQHWQQSVPLPAGSAGSMVEAVLIRADHPNSVYRRVDWRPNS